MPGSSTALRPGGTPGTLRPGIAGPARARLLPAPLAHPGHLDRRGGLPDHAVDQVRRAGREQLHRQRPRADPAEPALPPAVRGHAHAGHPVRGAGQLPGGPGPGHQRAGPVRARAPHVTAVGSPYQAPGQISPDGHIAFATVQFGVPGSQHPQRRGAVADARRAGRVRARRDLRPRRRRGRPGRDAVRRADRGHRRAGRRDRAADRVRLAAGHGPAGGHRGVRHRGRAVADRAARARRSRRRRSPRSSRP